MIGKLVAKYHGVEVYLSNGYYYPSVNGNIEKKSIKEVKEWIEDVWLFSKESIHNLAGHMGVPKDRLWNFFVSLN